MRKSTKQQKKGKKKRIRQPDEYKIRRLLFVLRALRKPRTLAELTALCGDRVSRTVRRDVQLLQRLGFQVVAKGINGSRRYKELHVVGWKQTMNRLLDKPTK